MRPSIGLSVRWSVRDASSQWAKTKAKATYALFVCLHTSLSVRCLSVGLSYLHMCSQVSLLRFASDSVRALPLMHDLRFTTLNPEVMRMAEFVISIYAYL